METRSLIRIVAVITSLLVALNVWWSFELKASSSPDNETPLMNLSQGNTSHVLSNRTFVLVHVGKTGGETVRHTLQVTCQGRRNPVEKQKCREWFSRHSESAISKNTRAILHCELLQPPISMEEVTTFLWTIRNPIDRIVSWFHYMNPANCQPLVDYHSTACNNNRSIASRLNEPTKKGSQWSVKFFTCFPSLSSFTTALLRPLDSDDPCSPLAWRTIRGESSPSAGHVYFHYQHYWGLTLKIHPHKEIWAVRTEQLTSDLEDVESLLSVTTTNQEMAMSPPNNLAFRNVTHGSEGHSFKEGLSIHGRHALCCAMLDEIAVYEKLILSAFNLNERSKQQSLERVASSCGVGEWQQLTTSCNATRNGKL
eukprot:Nitzschia sp. Nitz4//scaffold24_size164493//72654//73757//NITZ4_002327-RA/size164493-processed-gene-0.198-mRNA-1//1//CDS//3329544111//2673//frame0